MIPPLDGNHTYSPRHHPAISAGCTPPDDYIFVSHHNRNRPFPAALYLFCLALLFISLCFTGQGSAADKDSYIDDSFLRHKEPRRTGGKMERQDRRTAYDGDTRYPAGSGWSHPESQINLPVRSYPEISENMGQGIGLSGLDRDRSGPIVSSEAMKTAGLSFTFSGIIPGKESRMFHRLSIIFAIFLFFMTIHGNVAADGGDLDIVQLHSGPVKGKVEGGIRIFSGIPYAAPPVGHLRWTPPQDVMPWTEVRSGIDPVPSCPQPKQNPSGSFSEDCLYLNVWTPAKTPADKLPVMVWIHGGAFNFGSGTLPEYNGKNLAGKGVVVVTINYRLGPLGFLVHPLLSKESPQGVSGNYGLLDQIAALRWVQRNIASFGGDRNRVTIFGQSAGSRSVALLMISPLSKGLFHRAIAQSGGPIIGSEYLSPLFAGNMANVSTMGEMLAARLGCHEAPDIVAAMRTKTAQEVLTAADTKTTLFDDGGFFFAPVFDGWALPRNPMTAYSTGRATRCPSHYRKHAKRRNHIPRR